MKTKEEILQPYIEVLFRHTKIIEASNALKAMEEFANQFKREWIDAKTLLPDIKKCVWVTDGVLIGIAYRYGEGKPHQWIFTSHFYQKGLEVTSDRIDCEDIKYWKELTPLPEQPKEEQ